MVQPETAETLANRKADWIAPLKADIVASGNVGCLLQLQSALQRKGEKTRVLHTIQVLDASIRGIQP